VVRREAWLDLARQLDWEPSYVQAEELFPKAVSGSPWLPAAAWQAWDEPYRTSYAEYVDGQARKQAAVRGVFDQLANERNLARLDRGWQSALKLHAATFALAEFAATIGNLRAARFGRASAWRNMALLGALDELRHAQEPLRIAHEYLRSDAQFDWAHRLYHSNNWVGIAARHLVDELLLWSNPIEFAIGANFVFEDRLHQPTVHGPHRAGGTHGRPALARLARQHPDRRSPARADRWAGAGGGRRARPCIRASTARQVVLALLATLRRSHGFHVRLPDHRSKSAGSRVKEFVQEWVLDQYCAEVARYGSNHLATSSSCPRVPRSPSTT